MLQEIVPIGIRPSMLSGLSEQMVVSHYEDIYGKAVRTLNAVRRELAALDADAPPNRLRGLKRDELALMHKRNHPDGLLAAHPLAIAHHLIGNWLHGGKSGA